MKTTKTTKTTIQITPEERETVINTDDALDFVKVYTFDRKLINRMKKFQAERPTECKLIHDWGDGCYEWYIPKSWLYRIGPGPKRAPMTEEARLKAAKNLARAREAARKAK